MAQVPLAWTQLVDQHRRAQVAHDEMRNRDLPQGARDEATVRHARALDAMYDAMNRLSEQMVTDKVTGLLGRKGVA